MSRRQRRYRASASTRLAYLMTATILFEVALWFWIAGGLRPLG